MKINIWLTVFLLIFTLGGKVDAINFVDHNSKEGLEIIAEMLNQQAPISYQNGLTLVNVIAGDKNLRWLLKLDDTNIHEFSEKDVHEWLMYYQSGIISNTCNDKAMVENVISQGTEFVYVIINSDHERLMYFLVNNSTCSALST